MTVDPWLAVAGALALLTVVVALVVIAREQRLVSREQAVAWEHLGRRAAELDEHWATLHRRERARIAALEAALAHAITHEHDDDLEEGLSR